MWCITFWIIIFLIPSAVLLLSSLALIYESILLLNIHTSYFVFELINNLSINLFCRRICYLQGNHYSLLSRFVTDFFLCHWTILYLFIVFIHYKQRADWLLTLTKYICSENCLFVPSCYLSCQWSVGNQKLSFFASYATDEQTKPADAFANVFCFHFLPFFSNLQPSKYLTHFICQISFSYKVICIRNYRFLCCLFNISKN